MEKIWAESVFPGESIVLGIRLRPYCCGHELTLSELESPLILGGKASWEQLFIGVVVCSQTFEEGRKLLRQKFRLKLFTKIWLLLFRKKLFRNPEMFHVELSKWRSYIEAGNWSPETNHVVEKGVTMRELKAPRIYRLIPFLCTNLNLTESQALNFPIARTHAYYAAEADKAGEIDLTGGRTDDALLKHLESLEARAANGEAVWDN